MLNKVRMIAAALALLAFGFAQDEANARKPQPISVQGTVYAVNASGRTVTLRESDGTSTTLNIARKSKLRRNNRKVAITGLVLGDQATAVVDASQNAKQLSANGVSVSTVQGGVVGVNSGSGIVQLETGNFSTNAQTRVVRNGKVTSLKSLTVHDHVTAHVTRGSALAHLPESVGDEPEDDTAVDVQVEGPEESEVEGTISAVDVEAGTVTITPEDEIPAITVNVTAETLIELLDDGATINDLTVGLLVEVVYDPVTFNAFRIEAEDEEGLAEGAITAIDTVAGTVTIDCYGTPVTLFVDASTKIERDEEPAVFADLQIGDEVRAEYNIVTMVAEEIEVREGEGDDDEGEGEGENDGEDEGEGEGDGGSEGGPGESY